MSTFEISRRNLMRLSAVGVGALGIAGFESACPQYVGSRAHAAPLEPATKTRATYYTPERVAAARSNIDSLSWAATIRDEAVAAAEPILDMDPEVLWASVSTQGLPRSYAVNQALGSPITGTGIFDWGAYPWLADVFNEPWKLRDPSSGYVFPTNDFASFYASALDENGNFVRELGDPQYLVNELYPERGPDWGVDDGYGWVDDDGEKWTFIAYYNHWFVWYVPQLVRGERMEGVFTTLRRLRDAYVYTGDVRYAHHGIILLDRFADAYPAMDTKPYLKSEGFLNSDGGRGQGKALGAIWENGMSSDLVLSYDAFFPALAEGDEAGVVPFLSAKAEEYGLAPKVSVTDIRSNIENGIVRQIYPAVRNAQIFGNFGVHQATLARAAVVMDDPEATPEWLDFVFAPGGLTRLADGSYINTGGNVGPTLVNQVDRDGWYAEAAPNYNILPVAALTAMANVLDGYDLYPSADLYDHPKYSAMVAARSGLTMLGLYTPSIGDSGQTGAPLLLGTASVYVTAFERYGNVADAQMAYLLNGNTTEGLRGDIFNPDSAGIEDRIQDVIDEHGPLNLETENLTGFGLSMNRVGEGSNARAMTLYYGSNLMHGHRNALSLGYFGFGLDLLPGLGYPEFADQNARRYEWESNTVASNTTVVDRTRHANMVVGRPLGFLESPEVQHTDAEAPAVYPQLDRYRRTSTLVNIDEEHGYIVDLFRITGGSEHVFSFHTAEGEATVDGVEMVAQEGGSYAGPDIIHPDPRSRPRPGVDGFDWLTRVERGTPSGQFTVEWDIEDTYDVLDGDDIRMRLTMLNAADEVALADGIPPRNKPGNPDSLRYLLVRRDASSSCFTSVIEPYRETPSVVESRLLEATWAGGDLGEDAVAVEVTLADGRTDWVVHDTRGDRELMVGGRFRVTARLAVIRFDANGRLASVTGDGITEIRDGRRMILRARPITGTVADHTRELSSTSEIELALDHPVPGNVDLVGRHIYIEDDGERNAVYPITAVDRRGRRMTVGTDTTLVRSYVDDTDLDAGYVYDVAPGRAFRIPLAGRWTA